MKKYPDHKQNLVALRRVEGQLRGIQRMIDNKRYCVDILTQISSAGAALLRVQDNILQRHLDGCVKTAMSGNSDRARQKKMDEIFRLIKKFRKSS